MYEEFTHTLYFNPFNKKLSIKTFYRNVFSYLHPEETMTIFELSENIKEIEKIMNAKIENAQKQNEE